ncbi:hypothetical protein FTW19_06075 [Terriglobus albidus]|uniref:DUF4013 domain-containing protein n=1 Tax=Terriglobus albidus TaxID=1592106 RepID=A0A5B9E908_9BACT|nr:hypothetical protein [Terriglobus albidus]QEE27605.1 hypothetical protein FTW19_06075 [Terriglobus albidus]
MNTLSASECIGPAWERTKQILFERRKLGLYFKLTLCAVLAEAGSLLSLPNFAGLRSGAAHPIAAKSALAMAAVSGILIFVVFIFTTILFLVGSRMQLVMVDVVATRQIEILPLWRKHGAPVWRWMALKLLPSLLFYVLVVIATLRYTRGITARLRSTVPGQLPPGFFPAFLQFFLVISFVSLCVFAIYWLLRDFVMPFIALENASLATALERGMAVVRDEPGQVVLYMLLRVALFIVFAIGGYIVYVVAALLGLVPIGLLGAVFYLLAHKSPLAGVLMGIGSLIGLCVLLVWILFVMVLVAGFICTFFQAYALYFLGGRYPLLGEILEPVGQSWWNLQPSAPFDPPPAAPGNAEEQL